MFFLGYILGSSFNKNGASSEDGGFSIIGLIIGLVIYFKLKGFVITKFSDYLPLLALILICLTAIIVRFNYCVDYGPTLRVLIFKVAKIVSTVVAAVIGIVIFNKTGTPFSYIIEHFNLFHIQSNNIVEAFFQILGFILRIADELFRLSFFAYVQGVACRTVYFFEDKMYLQNKKDEVNTKSIVNR